MESHMITQRSSYKMAFTLVWIVWNLVFSNGGSGNCIIDRVKLTMSFGGYHFLK